MPAVLVFICAFYSRAQEFEMTTYVSDLQLRDCCRLPLPKMHQYLSAVLHGVQMEILLVWMLYQMKFIRLMRVFLDVFLLTGVAFTKHLIHLYAYTGSNELRQHLEVSSDSGAFPERPNLIAI